MNSKLVMSASAITLALLGLTLTFLSSEVMVHLRIGTSNTLQLLMQILGALLFAFAILNWMAKGSTIGGIYNRPIALANFTHFVIGALTLAKAVMSSLEQPMAFWILTGVYMIFAILFGLILFRSRSLSHTGKHT
jgi:hypothetical protein